MKIVIIEDEKPAADKLQRLLKLSVENSEILVVLPSIQKAVKWFGQGEEYDLVFMDIQLADGLCFEIFKKVTIQKPVIFTTAYNEYAIEAFKVNSIDYLLKPITAEKVESSLNKLETLRQNLPSPQQPNQLEQINQMLASLQKNYKSRFMVKLGEHIRSVAVEKIAYFLAEDRHVSLFTLQGRRFLIDYKMEELENMLDPKLFFRVNRSFTVGINSIQDVLVYSNSRLKVSTEPVSEKEIIVSREKVAAFKDWFNDGEIE